jgi:hypothetical protein
MLRQSGRRRQDGEDRRLRLCGILDPHRAFSTKNAEKLTLDAFPGLTRRKSWQARQVCVNDVARETRHSPSPEVHKVKAKK